MPSLLAFCAVASEMERDMYQTKGRLLPFLREVWSMQLLWQERVRNTSGGTSKTVQEMVININSFR